MKCSVRFLPVFLALAGVPVHAADKWIHATSPHFDMVAAESENDVKAALQHLETVRAFFAARTNSQDPGGQPVHVVVFHSSVDYERARPEQYAGSNAYSISGTPATIVTLGLKPDNYEKIFQNTACWCWTTQPRSCRSGSKRVFLSSIPR